MGTKRRDPPLRLYYQRTTGGGRGGSPEAEWAVQGGLSSLLALATTGSCSEAERQAGQPEQPERGLVLAWALGVRGCNGDPGPQPASSGSPYRASAPPASATVRAAPGEGAGERVGNYGARRPPRPKAPRDPSPGSRAPCLAGS